MRSDTKWKESPHQQMFHQNLNVAHSKQRAVVLKYSGLFDYYKCSVFNTRSGSGPLAATWWVKCLYGYHKSRLNVGPIKKDPQDCEVLPDVLLKSVVSLCWMSCQQTTKIKKTGFHIKVTMIENYHIPLFSFHEYWTTTHLQSHVHSVCNLWFKQ